MFYLGKMYFRVLFFYFISISEVRPFGSRLRVLYLFYVFKLLSESCCRAFVSGNLHVNLFRVKN